MQSLIFPHRITIKGKARGSRPGGGRALRAQGPLQEGRDRQGPAGARQGREASPAEHVSPSHPRALLDVPGKFLRFSLDECFPLCATCPELCGVPLTRSKGTVDSRVER